MAVGECVCEKYHPQTADSIFAFRSGAVQYSIHRLGKGALSRPTNSGLAPAPTTPSPPRQLQNRAIPSHLLQGHVVPPDDVEDDPLGLVDGRVEQRGRDGGVSGVLRLRLALPGADAHQRRARVAHHRPAVKQMDERGYE